MKNTEEVEIKRRKRFLRFLEAVKKEVCLESDRALADYLNINPTSIPKWRNLSVGLGRNNRESIASQLKLTDERFVEFLDGKVKLTDLMAECKFPQPSESRELSAFLTQVLPTLPLGEVLRGSHAFLDRLFSYASQNKTVMSSGFKNSRLFVLLEALRISQQKTTAQWVDYLRDEWGLRPDRAEAIANGNSAPTDEELVDLLIPKGNGEFYDQDELMQLREFGNNADLAAGESPAMNPDANGCHC